MTRTSLEVIAPTVEEAIAKGLSDLGLEEDAVDVEVLDLGSRGLFGLGTRQARIRLTIKAQSTESMDTVDLNNEVEKAEKSPPSQATLLTDEQKMAIEAARETVIDLVQRMNVQARVTAEIHPPDDERSRETVWVDVRGDDLSILIGPRAEVLNALQYITSLIVAKELGKTIQVIVDVEGYRVRRVHQLRQLANRMADQAIKTGRRQVLEPMPANERRIIHIELRNNPEVVSESIGEDPYRKVTIAPKSAA